MRAIGSNLGDSAVLGRLCALANDSQMRGSSHKGTLNATRFTTNRIYTTRYVFSLLPQSDRLQAANFGGLIATESWSFPPEKWYSPAG